MFCLHRSRSFTLRDLAVENCNSRSSLIDLEPNCTPPAISTIRLLRVTFERNELTGDARILNSGTPLCYQLELEDVVIKENICSKESCVMLSSQNTLKNVELYRNRGNEDSSPGQSIFFAPEGSAIIATNVTSEENRIRSFHLSNSTLNLTGSHFNNNKKSQSSGTRANSIGGGVLCSNNSTLLISDTIFENNLAFNGGGLFVFSSNVNISDCTFEENDADEGNGGAIYSHHNSSLDISSSRFLGNRGYRGAAIYSEDTFMMTILNSSILENRCSQSCSVHISGGTVIIRECKFHKNRARQTGGAFCAGAANVTLDNSSFIGNNATSNGGGCAFRSKSRVQANNLTFRNNIAFDNDGGGIHLSSRSQLQIRDSLFSKNEAVKGGAIFAFSKSLLVLSHSIFISNQAGYGNAINMDECDNGSISDCNFTNHSNAYHGGVLYFESGNNGTISNCNFTHNRVGNRAGVIYLDGFHNATISNSNFTNNRAYEGGVLYMDFSKNGRVSNCNFINNTASNGGAFGIYIVSSLSVFDSVFSSNEARGNGVVHLLDSNLTLQSVTMTNNSAETGGALYAYRANINITNSTFEKSSASRSGGSIYMEQANATLEDMTLQSNEAKEDCGGVCVYRTSYLNASNLTIQSSSAGNVGGGIAVDNSSSILCYSCMILNNRADRGAGLHVYADNSIPIVAQLQNSRFENNSAYLYGGGIEFNATLNRTINCSSSRVDCGSVVLLNTHFIGNLANLSGGAIITTRANGVLIDCESKGQLRGFVNKSSLHSLTSISSNSSCSSRKSNQESSNTSKIDVSTFGQKFNLSLATNDGVELVGDLESGYVLKNVSSGTQLPQINVTILDEFEEGPAFTEPRSFESRLSSLNGFFSGLYPVNISNGVGKFSDVAGFARPGNYTLQIESDIPSLRTFNVTVIVRECLVDEEPTSDRLTCQECDAVSYNFNTSQVGGCTQCPRNANCAGRYIVPNEGHWHKSPCHNTVQECLVEKACSYEERNDVLINFTNSSTHCNFNESKLEAYKDDLCNEGYEGLLCGSCKTSYGLSATFQCLKCPITIFSILIIIGITIYLLLTAAFTIRGCLPLSSKPQDDPSTSNRSTKVANSSRGEMQVDIEMVTMLDEDKVPRKSSKMQKKTNSSQSQSQLQTQTSSTQHENEYELTRWKTTEILKILINFLQTIAIASNISVRWTSGMLGLFESSEYAGVLTTAAMTRPVDCIVSSSSPVYRAIWRMLLSLFVPLLVMIIFFLFWSGHAINKGKGWGYFSRRCTLSVIAITYISYLGLTRMAVRAFYCIDVYDFIDHSIFSKRKFWAIDTAIRCYGKDHFAIIAIAVIVLALITVSYPLFFAIILSRKKESLRRRDSWTFETTGFLFRAFKQKFAYWESLVMFRKACLSVIVVFSYPLGGDSQGLLASILLFFCLYVHLTLKPYRKEFKILNHFESMALLISGLTFNLGVFFVNGRFRDSIRIFLAVLIILGNSSFFLFLLLALFYYTMVHLRVVLQYENVPLPDPPTWWNILKVYISLRMTQWRQSLK
eukprot:g3777.t1